MISSEQEILEKKRLTQKISLKEGSLSGLVDGVGTKFVSPYAISLGASNSQIGLLNAIPTLLGNFFTVINTSSDEESVTKTIDNHEYNFTSNILVCFNHYRLYVLF